MRRAGLWVVICAAGMIAGATAARAQQSEPVDPNRRKAELQKEIDDTEQQLAALRNQRVQLQARLDSVVAARTAERARVLLASTEQSALLQLDSLLSVAQGEMRDERDQMMALGDAVRRRTGAVLVVTLRADSSQSQTLGRADLLVDDAPAAERSYTAVAQTALQMGAVDELYRADVLPTAHAIELRATVNGQPLTQRVDVTAAGQSITYVQFLVRNGQLIPSTLTSRTIPASP
ncbi:MAG TPA: hypothetical protein VFK13_11470 [Gemmatimonadaceae bacterium]|nr:hypothetical protein [Gemmatimonadaceae bacterium]